MVRILIYGNGSGGVEIGCDILGISSWKVKVKKMVIFRKYMNKN